jgi:hypothetical protein
MGKHFWWATILGTLFNGIGAWIRYMSGRNFYWALVRYLFKLINIIIF